MIEYVKSDTHNHQTTCCNTSRGGFSGERHCGHPFAPPYKAKTFPTTPPQIADLLFNINGLYFSRCWVIHVMLYLL